MSFQSVNRLAYRFTLPFLFLLLSAAVFPLSAAQTVRVDVDLVNIFVTVQDAAGGFVTDLSAADFRIYEDGVEQKIGIFETEDGVSSAIGIMLDNSLSMVDILSGMKSGVLDFARRNRDFARLFVMSFGTRLRLLQDVRDPLSRLESELDLLRPQGTSLLFDGLIQGMTRVGLNKDAERKALIVFTDGTDTASQAGFREVLLEAQKTGALLYFIPIGARVLIDEHTLDSLAAETGGRVVYLTRSEPIPPAMETIRRELAMQYYVAYYASRKPGFHSIRVEIPGRDVKIRAKTGYYGS